MTPEGFTKQYFEHHFPEHAKAKANWDKSNAISMFLDYAMTKGVELCKRHRHVEACYRATGETVVIAGLVCGVSGRTVVCGLEDGVFYPLSTELSEFAARYFDVNLGAYDREELELRKFRDITRSGPPCNTCHGLGAVTVSGGGMMPALGRTDDEPCPACKPKESGVAKE